MAVNAIRLVFAILVTLIIPGFLLVRALWPRGDRAGAPGPVGTIVCTIGFSVAITTLVGVTLGFLPHAAGSRGWFQSAATGLPIVEVTLLAVSLGLFAVGWARGAYPRLSRRDRSPHATASTQEG